MKNILVVMILSILVGCTMQPTGEVVTSSDELLNELQVLRSDNQMLFDKVASLENILLKLETSIQEESNENSDIVDLDQYYSVLKEELKFDVDDPDGLFHHYDSKVLDGDYEIGNLDYYIEQISGFLTGYEVYYENTWKTLEPGVRDKVKSNDRFTPAIDIDMYNYYFLVTAAIKDYEYIKNKLDLSNAIKEYEDGIISVDVLDAKLQKFREAKVEYEEFIATAHGAD